ncbi:MAG: hypothetical protein HBSAPP03_19420 [Phycisphaerae bacterium]|nr:MAG: hypothetical protein HBSAPP03_19420 [Phycisphaerae bacterium]
MDGDDRVRRCGQCDKYVYNVTAMTRDEAERLIVAREGRACLRLYRRADGTVLTADCPVGLARVRARAARLALRTVAAVLAVVTAVVMSRTRATTVNLDQIEPFATLARWARPTGVTPVGGQFLVGEMCAPGPWNGQ